MLAGGNLAGVTANAVVATCLGVSWYVVIVPTSRSHTWSCQGTFAVVLAAVRVPILETCSCHYY